MAFSISRQIKLRSVEQAIFKPSYNRLNFFIQPDGLSTDLSQSYLSMRVYLTNAITGDRLTTTEMRTLIANNLVVSFGNGDLSYSPACMIRVARLFANKGNELLEEVNFANVLTQTVIHQLCNDFETLEANNLLTGSSSQIGHGSSLPASVSAFINNPTEVHIYLRDLFGVCRHSNFELMATDGLNLTLELEDKQNLFKVSTLGDFQRISVKDVSGNTINAVLPEVFVNPAEPGYIQNANTLANTPVARGQFIAPTSNLLLDPSGNVMIQYPKEGFLYDSTYFEPIVQADVITQLVMSGTYTADQLTALGLVAGAYLKIRFAISSAFTGASNLAPKEFTYMVEIASTTDGANPALVFASTYSLWWDADGGRTVDTLVSLMDVELLHNDEVAGFNIASGDQAVLKAFLAGNLLAIDDAHHTRFQQLGLIDADGNPTAVTFDLAVQMYGDTASATAGSHIMPDVILNETSPNIRKIYSNQLTKLPTQGAKTSIQDFQSIDPNVPEWASLFTSWGCESGTSIQPYTIYPTGDTSFVKLGAYGINVFIWNVQNHKQAPNAVSITTPIPALYSNLSYEIDKFELVLIQQSIDPKNRMPSPFIYSTWKLETATIETAQATYARQFILEENVYNCFLLTPQWNDKLQQKGGLISQARGVSYYRYSVNQVNQTNRDVYLSTFRSSYPSSLYLDRLNDTFSNSDYILRSPVGIKGVQETTYPTLLYPLKIYHAVSEQAYVMGHPGGATVQINLFADTSSGGNIQPGNIFFFKQVLKQLA
jgi:hypothetical protein